MNEKKENYALTLQTYSTGLASLITISATGLAFSAALMQFANNNIGKLHIAASILLIISLFLSFLAFSGLTGQASKENPNINVKNIKYPALFSFFFSLLGFVLLSISSYDQRISNSIEEEDLDNLIACEKLLPNKKNRKVCLENLYSLETERQFNYSFEKLSTKDKIWISKLIILLNKK